jgi:cytochrome c553
MKVETYVKVVDKVRVAGAAAGFALAALAMAAGGAALAAEPVDVSKGQQIAGTVCAACHAADGNSTITANPRLAGQSAEYLAKQLADLTKPADDKAARVNAVMGAMAMSLSESDRRNVAAWFAGQKPTFDVSAEKDKDKAALGQRIYRTGLPDRAVPACAGCHGPAGSGLPVIYPRIGGQHAEYVAAQLKAFREGTRRNNLAMAQIANRLSDPEMAAVSDYVAGLRAR